MGRERGGTERGEDSWYSASESFQDAMPLQTCMPGGATLWVARTAQLSFNAHEIKKLIECSVTADTDNDESEIVENAFDDLCNFTSLGSLRQDS